MKWGKDQRDTVAPFDPRPEISGRTSMGAAESRSLMNEDRHSETANGNRKGQAAGKAI